MGGGGGRLDAVGTEVQSASLPMKLVEECFECRLSSTSCIPLYLYIIQHCFICRPQISLCRRML
jgi:hypothetical protein